LPENVRSLLSMLGGVVFTNGDLDGWAGGSLLSYSDLWGHNHAPVDLSAEWQAAKDLPSVWSQVQLLATAGRKLFASSHANTLQHIHSSSSSVHGDTQLSSRVRGRGQLAFVT